VKKTREVLKQYYFQHFIGVDCPDCPGGMNAYSRPTVTVSTD